MAKKTTFDRKVNVSTKVSSKQSSSKVNNGVFVYTGAISVGELAKSLDILASDIIKL